MTLSRCQVNGKGDCSSPARVQSEPIFPHQGIGSLHCRMPAVMTPMLQSTICLKACAPLSTDSHTGLCTLVSGWAHAVPATSPDTWSGTPDQGQEYGELLPKDNPQQHGFPHRAAQHSAAFLCPASVSSYRGQRAHISPCCTPALEKKAQCDLLGNCSVSH